MRPAFSACALRAGGHGGGRRCIRPFGLIRQTGLCKQLCHNAAQLPALQPRGHAPGHEDQIIAADVVVQMLVDGRLHHAAGAVALHGVADLFGGGQTHAGLFCCGS